MSDEDISIADFFRITRRNWFWSLLSFVIVFGLVLSYIHFTEPVYEATSLISVTNQGQAYFVLGNAAPKVADLETQKLIIQSPQVTQSLYNKYGKDSFELTVNSVRNADLLEISVQAHAPADAVLILDELLGNYVNYTAQSNVAQAESTVVFIQERIETYDAQITSITDSVEFYETRLSRNRSLSDEDERTYNQLKKELQVKSELYDYLLTKKEEAMLAANLNSANIQIIYAPEVALDPIRPNKELTFALGFVLGLGAALFMASAINSAQPRKRSVVRR